MKEMTQEQVDAFMENRYSEISYEEMKDIKCELQYSKDNGTEIRVVNCKDKVFTGVVTGGMDDDGCFYLKSKEEGVRYINIYATKSVEAL